MSYRLEIGLALLVLLAMGVALWAGSRKPATPDFDYRSSTFISGPHGSKGLHDVLRQLGRLSERRRTSLANLAHERARRTAILVLLDPWFPLDDGEVDQVVHYVRAGGAVLATGDGGGLTDCTGWRTQALVGSDSIAVRWADPAVRLPAARYVLTRRVKEDTDSRLEALRKTSVEDAPPDLCNTLVPFTTDTIVAALNNRPVVIRMGYRGGGTITLAADRRWFTNQFWRDSDVPLIGVPLLTPSPVPPRPGRVVWDEYHQGFGDTEGPSLEGGTWIWLRTSPAGWAILQLIAVALVWLAMTAIRFGPAREAVERRRRSPLEHLEALGAGLESAADADTAVRRLAQGLRRRLSRTAYLGTDDVGPWLEGLELAMRGPQGRAAVRRLHHLLTVRDRGAESARVLHAAQAVEDVWEELRPRSTRNAS